MKTSADESTKDQQGGKPLPLWTGCGRGGGVTLLLLWEPREKRSLEMQIPNLEEGSHGQAIAQ